MNFCSIRFFSEALKNRDAPLLNPINFGHIMQKTSYDSPYASFGKNFSPKFFLFNIEAEIEKYYRYDADFFQTGHRVIGHFDSLLVAVTSSYLVTLAIFYICYFGILLLATRLPWMQLHCTTTVKSAWLYVRKFLRFSTYKKRQSFAVFFHRKFRAFVLRHFFWAIHLAWINRKW